MRLLEGHPPAHLVYGGRVLDKPTLLLVAESAVCSGFSEEESWRSWSTQARSLTKDDVNVLARFTAAAASVRHHDSELMQLGGHVLWRQRYFKDVKASNVHEEGPRRDPPCRRSSLRFALVLYVLSLWIM